MLKLLFQDARDRLNGNNARANARLGLVRPPEGTGKIVWLVADETYDSVLISTTLLAAIREKRKDVRLVLTYQTEYQDLIIKHMSGLSKIGFGFGCGDSHFAIKQMLKRLTPFAIIFIGHSPSKTMMKALRNTPEIHKIAFQTGTESIGDGSDDFFEACYPHSLSAATKTNSRSVDSDAVISKPFNVLTRLVQSQIDKQLGSMLCGESKNALFHVHNIDKNKLRDFLTNWKSSELSQNSLLAFSFSKIDSTTLISVQKSVKKLGLSPVLLSKWNQKPLTKNEIIIADEDKWFAAICASSAESHLFNTTAFHLWQAISSGSVITLDKDVKNKPSGFDTVISNVEFTHDLISTWKSHLNNPALARKITDQTRQLFWSERREAEMQVDTFLQRVYDW